MKHAISNGLIHLGNFPFVNNFNSSMPHRFIQFIIFCREDIPNELLNNPFHNHPNKLLARSARNAEKQSHQDGCQQPQATVAAPRRVLGDLTSSISLQTRSTWWIKEYMHGGNFVMQRISELLLYMNKWWGCIQLFYGIVVLLLFVNTHGLITCFRKNILFLPFDCFLPFFYLLIIFYLFSTLWLFLPFDCSTLWSFYLLSFYLMNFLPFVILSFVILPFVGVPSYIYNYIYV